ncbi:MAG: Mrp family chromosome partitioning ATPase, partial [Porticoccaceae bacterium]
MTHFQRAVTNPAGYLKMFDQQPTQIIGIASGKGGVGKT